MTTSYTGSPLTFFSSGRMCSHSRSAGALPHLWLWRAQSRQSKQVQPKHEHHHRHPPLLPTDTHSDVLSKTVQQLECLIDPSFKKKKETKSSADINVMSCDIPDGSPPPPPYWLLPLLCGTVFLSSCSACSTSLTRSDTDVYCRPVSRYLVWTKLSTKLLSKPICSTVCTTGESRAEEAARPPIISGRGQVGRNGGPTDHGKITRISGKLKTACFYFPALNTLRSRLHICWCEFITITNFLSRLP